MTRGKKFLFWPTLNFLFQLREGRTVISKDPPTHFFGESLKSANKKTKLIKVHLDKHTKKHIKSNTGSLRSLHYKGLLSGNWTKSKVF